MRWEPPDAEGRFGFSTVTPWTDPGEALPGVNVAEQRADEASVWHAYRRLIALRNALPALDVGGFELLAAGPRAVLAARRSAEGDAPGGRVVLLANLGARPASVPLAELGVARTDVAAVHQPLLPPTAAGAALTGDAVELQGLQLVVLELR